MENTLNGFYGNINFWRKELFCTGNTLKQNIFPACYSLITIKSSDIEKRPVSYMKKIQIVYGFTYPKCKCFTEINKDDIPDYVRENAKFY